ncbi:MAG: hypothetical protein ABFQ95_07775, partial [Pseudomonadota bacterium]
MKTFKHSLKMKSAILLSLLTTPSLTLATSMIEPETSVQHSQQLNQDTINFEDLRKTLSSIDEVIPTEQKQAVMIIGLKGTGKSTLFNMLQFEGDESGITYYYNDSHDVEFERQDGKKFLSAIGAGSLSKTKIPIMGKQYWDCPGFEHTGDAIQSILNAYSIHRLFKHTSKIKIILTSSWGDYDSGRSANVLMVMKRLGEIFSQNPDKLENGLCMVVSKFSPDLEHDKAIKVMKVKLKKLYNEQEELINENSLKILLNLSDLQKNNIGIFRVPTYLGIKSLVDVQERKNIESILEAVDFMEGLTPKLSLDPNAKSILKDFHSKTIVGLNNGFENFYKFMGKYIQQFVVHTNLNNSSAIRNFFDQTTIALENVVSNGKLNNFVTTLESFLDQTKSIFLRDEAENIKLARIFSISPGTPIIDAPHFKKSCIFFKIVLDSIL